MKEIHHIRKLKGKKDGEIVVKSGNHQIKYMHAAPVKIFCNIVLQVLRHVTNYRKHHYKLNHKKMKN